MHVVLYFKMHKQCQDCWPCSYRKCSGRCRRAQNPDRR